MTEPIRPPTDDLDVVRFLNECTSAIFDVMDHALEGDCEVAADCVRQMLIEQAAKYKISRRGRPWGAKTKNPAEKLSPSSLARRRRRERAVAAKFDKYLVAAARRGEIATLS
jgi:hypothetical protein